MTLTCGAQYVVECDSDRIGGDYENTASSSLPDCIQQCANDVRCIQISYVPGRCYLKDSIAALRNTTSVQGAHILSHCSGATVAASSSSTPAPTTIAKVVRRDSKVEKAAGYAGPDATLSGQCTNCGAVQTHTDYATR